MIMEMKFSQPCLIKKNTKTLRKKLEEIGYSYAPIKSNKPNYDNLKEPWIICAYDIYICADKEFYNNFKQEVKELTLNIDAQNVSNNIICFTKHEEDRFLDCASKK